MSVHVKIGPTRKDGRQPLFLLTYHKSYHPSKPLRESLDTYVYASPKTPEEKRHNKERLMYAEKVKMQREVDFDAVGGVNAFQNQGSFLEYFKILMKEKRGVEGNYTTWKATYKHLMIFLNGKDVKFKDCDDAFLQKFKSYLSRCKSIKSIKTDLSNNSANIYLSKVKAALNQAVKDRIISDNPGDRVSNIKMQETFREFLTEQEIGKLTSAECKLPHVKKVFLFSCMTGLRWCDIQKLTWKEIVYSEQDERWKLYFTQKKTKSNQYLPIPKNTINLLGERGGDEEKVFKNLKYSAHSNKILAEWVVNQGINKHITFHCARHSFATIMLHKTGNPYTVSDFLGHKDIKTTMIYAKILSTDMNKAVDLFPDFNV